LKAPFSPRHRAIEREAEIVLHQRDEIMERSGCERRAAATHEFPEIRTALHQREFVPARSVVNNGLGTAAPCRTNGSCHLAKSRRDHAIHDAGVEGIAGNANAGMAERLRPEDTSRAREAHDREIAGAAAEIGDKDGCVAFKISGEGERGADRLVGVAGIAGAKSPKASR